MKKYHYLPFCMLGLLGCTDSSIPQQSKVKEGAEVSSTTPIDHHDKFPTGVKSDPFKTINKINHGQWVVTKNKSFCRLENEVDLWSLLAYKGTTIDSVFRFQIPQEHLIIGTARSYFEDAWASNKGELQKGASSVSIKTNTLLTRDADGGVVYSEIEHDFSIRDENYPNMIYDVGFLQRRFNENSTFRDSPNTSRKYPLSEFCENFKYNVDVSQSGCTHVTINTTLSQLEQIEREINDIRSDGEYLVRTRFFSSEFETLRRNTEEQIGYSGIFTIDHKINFKTVVPAIHSLYQCAVELDKSG